VAAEWYIVIGVLALTIVVCLLAGNVVSYLTTMSRSTAGMGLMPGGATISIALSDDVGSDARLVAVIQYSRLYLVLLSLPFISHILNAGGAESSSDLSSGHQPSAWIGMLLLVGCLAVTLPLMHWLNFPSGYMLIPLILASLFAVYGPENGAEIPHVLFVASLGLIGLFVGLQFTLESLKDARNSLPVILVSVAALIAICAGLGFLMAAAVGRSMLDGYLATTPGGLNVVLGIAADSHVDIAFITAAQVLRVLANALMLPLIAAMYTRGSSRGHGEATAG
jgi:membrane AbrB-like protein